MATVDNIDEPIEQYHLALDEFLKGNPKPVQKRTDRTLGNDVCERQGEARSNKARRNAESCEQHDTET